MLKNITKKRKWGLSDSMFTGGSVECLGEVNAAREAAGFANFIKAETEKEKITDPGSTELPEGGWKDLCEHLIPVSRQAGCGKASFH